MFAEIALESPEEWMRNMSGQIENPETSPAFHYQVLARKYRPMTFTDLIGQEPMVRTLTNAFRTGRIAQGYMLTGVRGVGKTTTARIIARALNYEVAGEIDAPCVEMTRPGVHCAAIMESRHVDVIEMDAASHTGIGDIREIIESVRYKPISARYKVYIIDEVHMLSNQAFNGLLKTLEEPPEHVKFIFATTEIRKVPITVLSRCQRFDLRRIEVDDLIGLMRSILIKEGFEATEEALSLIAAAGAGSARDSLSILDRAIAHSGASIEAAHVHDMLGLADRVRVIALFRAVMGGDVAGALAELRAQYEAGADPVMILSDLASVVHLITRIKYVPDVASDKSLSECERREGAELAARLDMRVLARAWQMLLKGMEEVRSASWSLSAAEMLLVRLAHMSDLPTPDEVIRLIREERKATRGIATPSETEGSGSGTRAQGVLEVPGGGPADELAVVVGQVAGSSTPLSSFEDIVALASEKRNVQMKLALVKYVRPVRFKQGYIEIALTDDAPRNLVGELSGFLQEWTGKRWMVSVSAEQGMPTMAEREKLAQDRLMHDVEANQDVKNFLSCFPGARIVNVRDRIRSSVQPQDMPVWDDTDDGGE